MRWTVALWWLGILAFGSGCAHSGLRPASNAQRVEGQGGAAQASWRGVRVVADGRAWKGVPPELRAVRPVKVLIENGGETPVRVSYKDFSLLAPQGVKLAALPPMEIRATEMVEQPNYYSSAFVPGFGYRGFWLSPYHRRFYRGISPWPGAFAYDPFFYRSQFVQWPVQLPTGDMLSKAIPEGVIQPGGHLLGFLYFKAIPEGTRELKFHFDVVNADKPDDPDENERGTIEIPFQFRG